MAKVLFVKPEVKINHMTREKAIDLMKIAEYEGRRCYQSRDKITEDSYKKFIKKIVKSGHLSVLRTIIVHAEFLCSRSCSHQLVRTAHLDYLQESQRYVDSSKVGFRFKYTDDKKIKKIAIKLANNYSSLRKKYSPQDARDVLPNMTMTEVGVFGNLQAWWDFFKLRCNNKAQKEIRNLSFDLLNQMRFYFPEVFDFLYEDLLR